MKNAVKQTVIDKGFYKHPQEAGQIQVKQYIIVRSGDKKLLLLRFFNESEVNVSGITIALTQINSRGEAKKVQTIAIPNAAVRPQDTFSTKKGIVIDEDCVDFKIEFKCIYSSSYVYRPVHGRLRPHFDPIKESDKFRSRGRIMVKKTKLSRCHLSAIAAILGIIGTVALAVYLALRPFGNPDPELLLMNLLK